ncbi:hypothetical protein F5141DRAFT_1195755 [Pisolithus sp. B1]|nr:hypothetical protein F5141DRAFT_1195755 [Pisolithus sp. B1]
MLQALKEAGKCEPVQTAFCVGCVLVAPVILSTGYSRELPGNTHAEANALTKARFLSAADIATLFPSLSPTPTIDVLLALANVYTTLEPCSVRTSGLPPSKVKRCIIGVGEPDDFVKCEGARKLQEAGIEIVWLHDMQTECLAAARRAHIPTPR